MNLLYHHAIDINVPIGCGGVAIYPDDVMVGDADGVVAIPALLADEIAAAASEQEHLEQFILERSRPGRRCPGPIPRI